MDNVWSSITPSDYDAHMAHPQVAQIQLLTAIIGEQLALCANGCAAILGITNGSGLEHVAASGIEKLIGIDINEAFLQECRVRFPDLGERLELIPMDLMTESTKAADILAPCGLIIADLLISHIHLDNFMKIVAELPHHRQIVSCVIQVNPDGVIVSQSGFEHVFDDVVAHMEEEAESLLTAAMTSAGFALCGRTVYDLPNQKQFVRLDYAAS